MGNDYDHLQKRLEILKQALEIAEEGAGFLAKNEDFYQDYVLLPINLYIDILTFETSLHEMSRLKKMFEEGGTTRQNAGPTMVFQHRKSLMQLRLI